jgi:glutamine synthetase
VAVLRDSSKARQWLGADLIEHFVVMKEAELAAQARAVTDWEIARYLDAL